MVDPMHTFAMIAHGAAAILASGEITEKFRGTIDREWGSGAARRGCGKIAPFNPSGRRRNSTERKRVINVMESYEFIVVGRLNGP
jgi:hypothetical protein